MLNSYLEMVEKNGLEDMSQKYRDIFEDVMILGPAIPPIEQIRGHTEELYWFQVLTINT